MALSLSELVEEARLSARALLDYGEHFFNPTVRLGVTGLSRAGKTVFITALIHGLTRGGRFPVFEAFASGRIARVVRGELTIDDLKAEGRVQNADSLHDRTRRIKENNKPALLT